GVQPLHVELFDRSQRLGRVALVEDVIQMAVTDRVEDQAMLVAQAVLFLLVGKTSRQLVSVGSRALADAATANEHLGLQQKLALAGLALHVVDGVALLNVGVKAEDHALFFTITISLSRNRSCLSIKQF